MSLANEERKEFLTLSPMSPICIKINIVPKTKPCGTPLTTSDSSDLCPSIVTDCVCSVRRWCNHCASFSVILEVARYSLYNGRVKATLHFSSRSTSSSPAAELSFSSLMPLVMSSAVTIMLVGWSWLFGSLAKMKQDCVILFVVVECYTHCCTVAEVTDRFFWGYCVLCLEQFNLCFYFRKNFALGI